MQGEIKNAHQLTEPGYYWWRMEDCKEWMIQFLSPINWEVQANILQGQFVGPFFPPRW